MAPLHLKAAERVAMPWRNGGGVTREVMVFPSGAGLAEFDWRVSIAEVGSDGPFSSFPGIDRLMAVLSGAGIRLDVEGRAAVELRPGDAPAAFSGDARTAGVLIDGPIRDLNVMTRRGVVSASLRHLQVKERLALDAVGPALLLWESGEAEILAGGARIAPAPLDAFYADQTDWRIEGDGKFWFVAFNPTPTSERSNAP